MMEKPFGLPYRTPFGCYFYETSRNEIITMNEELFQYIEAVLADEPEQISAASERTLQEFRELQECGYLAPSRIQNVQHPLSGELRSLLTRKIDKITIQVTQNCNLRCAYCIYSADTNRGQRSHSNHVISLETAKKAVDFYRDHSQDSDLAAIAFYGGEPLLEMRLIEEVVEYTKEVFEGKQLLFSVTTNATLLSEEAIEFFIENNFSLTLSMDGPKAIQDANRKFSNGQGSYDVVIRNIRRLYHRNPDYMRRVTISMVIDPDHNYSEIITLFTMPELREVELSYTFIEEDAMSRPPSENFQTQYDYDEFLAYIQHFRGDGTHYPSKLVERDIKLLESDIRRFKTNILDMTGAPGGPCVPGKLRLFINCFGDLYPCERVNEDGCMKIGTLDEGFDYRQADTLLNIGKLSSEKCRNCWAFSLCTICAKKVEDNGMLSPAKKMAACAEAKSIAFSKIINEILTYEDENHRKKMKRVSNEVTV